MSTAIPPMPADAATAPGLSEPQRIINTYIAPSKTFEDIRRNARWWVPWLLLTIVGVATGSVMAKKIDVEQMIRQQIANSRQAAQFESLPKDQQEQRIAGIAKFTTVLFYVAPIIFPLLGALVVGALMMATFNFVFEANVPFNRVLAIVFYAWLPTLIYNIFIIVTLLLRSDTSDINPRNIVASNPAAFMDVNSGSKFVYGMAASLDIFAIWIIVLMGIGFTLNAENRKRLTTGGAIVTVAAWYIVGRLVVSALGMV